MAVTTRTVIGKVLDASRQPTLGGEYRFTPTHKLTGTAGDLIPSRYVAAPFTAAGGGSFSVDLIANDSDDITPQGTTYRVDLFLTARPGRIMDSFNVVVPKAGSGVGTDGAGNIELGDLTPVAAPGQVFLYLTEELADQRYVRPGDLEPVDLTNYPTTSQAADIADARAAAAVAPLSTAIGQKVDTGQATTIADDRAAAAVAGQIAPIQAAVTDARKGVVDGAFGLSIGLHDAAPKSLYSTNNPAAEFDPVTNRTYLAYSSSQFRALAVRYLDHNTGVLSPAYFVDEYHITNRDDDHGAPSLTIDQKNRRLVIAHGVHNDKICVVYSSGMELASATWTVVRPNINGSYTMLAYDSVSQNLYGMLRRGATHGTTGKDFHEYGAIIKSTDGGATWTVVTAALINTKLVFPSDAATDFYGSDFDFFNGRGYISFAIAHGAAHDGPRYGAHVCCLDSATDTLKAVDGQAINLDGTTATDFTKIRIVAGDYTYPVKTAVNPAGKIMTVFNQFDATINGANGYVRNYAAYFDGTQWTVQDTATNSNYVYNGCGVNWRGGAWEILAIRNLSNDNVVATTAQKDVLAQATAGGDLIHLTSTTGLNPIVDTTWDAARFELPMCYVQVVRGASPALAFLVQGVGYGTFADTTGDTGTGDIGSYNVANWQSSIYFGYASTNLPAALNIQRRGDPQYAHNPVYALTGAAAVTPPTTMTALAVSPPLPRGTQKVRLKASVVANGTAGRIVLNFRAGGSNRTSDAQVTLHGAFTYAQLVDVEVPVGPDGSIEWSVTLDAGVTCTAQLLIRSHTMGAQRILSKTPVAAIAKKTNAIVTIPTTVADTTAPTAPTTVTATGGNTSASVAFSGASDNVAVTGYRIYSAASGGSPVATGSSSPLTVTGLTNGSAFTPYVSALDAAGNESPRTAGNTVTPAVPSDTTAPTAPTSVSATAGNATATITATGATDNVAVTALRVYTQASGGSVLATGSSPITVSGLVNGTAYTFWISAIDAAGNESPRASSNSVTPTAGVTPTLYSDTYDGTSGTTLAAYDATHYSGASTVLVLDGSGAARLSGTGTTATNYVGRYNQDVTANHRAELDVTAIGTTTSGQHPILVWGAVDDANYYRANWDGASSVWTLFKVVNGTATAITTSSSGAVLSAAAGTTAPTVPYTAVADVTGGGGSFSVSVGGTVVAAGTDSAPLGGHYGGWVMRGGNATASTRTQLENQRVGALRVQAKA